MKRNLHANPIGEDKYVVIILLLALGIMARFFVMEMGYNYDFESYLIVGEIVKNGGNVYAETHRYNYGFLFFLIQGFGYTIASHFPDVMVGLYRAYIVSVLCLADIGIATILAKRYSIPAAILYFLNPISIIITGYHNQFDNIAVFFALTACLLVNEQEEFSSQDALSILFFSLSLITKHIICFFFIWLIVNKNFPNIKKRIAYSCIPPAVFLMSFVPWGMRNQEAMKGIVSNVFMYRSYNNYPLLGSLLRLLSVSDTRYFFVFVILISFVGILSCRMSIQDSLLLYFVALVAFSSAIANQYLIIPIATLAINHKKVFYFLYSFIGTIYCLLNANELHLAERVAHRFISISNYTIVYAKEGGVAISLLTYILLVFIIMYMYEKNSEYVNGRSAE